MKTCTRVLVWIVLIVELCGYFVIGDQPCNAYNEVYDSIVCICNASYCDQISKIEPQPKGTYLLYSSSKSGMRFVRSTGNLSRYLKIRKKKEPHESIFDRIFHMIFPIPNNDDIFLNVHRSITFQTMEGFGGAFTDSAAYHYANMSEGLKKQIVMSFFSPEGIEHSMGRVPIGGSDFSLRPYAYNMFPENDTKLSNFSLTEEDYKLKIPFIRDAIKASSNKLHFLAAAWSPPIWMKNNRAWGGVNSLLPEYYQTWADYHVRFLEEYSKENITFWGISTGNEPFNGVTNPKGFNSLGWLPEDEARWIAKHMGPTIRKSKYRNIRIITIDDQRLYMPLWIRAMSVNTKALSYVDGLGIHWYTNTYTPSFFSDITHGVFRDKFLIATEACEGAYDDLKVEYGAWDRAERYINGITEDIEHWFVAWLDWNLILDTKGGPNWFNNFADATIIYDREKEILIKQPMFYIFGHFSKFIPRGSKRIQVNQVLGGKISKVGFLRPDGGITVVFYNRYKVPRTVRIREKGRGEISLDVPGRSIHSLVYW